VTPRSTLLPYTTLFRSQVEKSEMLREEAKNATALPEVAPPGELVGQVKKTVWRARLVDPVAACQAVLNGDIPVHAVSFSQSELKDRKSTRLNSSHVKTS